MPHPIWPRAKLPAIFKVSPLCDDVALAAGEDRAANRKLSEIPLARAGRAAFIALVVAAALVEIVSDSIPVGVAFLAIGGLVLGGRFLVHSRRAGLH
ncbi:MAG: hypothetical protein WB507_02575 [Solirubrobacterales bacterium]